MVNVGSETKGNTVATVRWTGLRKWFFSEFRFSFCIAQRQIFESIFRPSDLDNFTGPSSSSSHSIHDSFYHRNRLSTAQNTAFMAMTTGINSRSVSVWKSFCVCAVLCCARRPPITITMHNDDDDGVIILFASRFPLLSLRRASFGVHKFIGVLIRIELKTVRHRIVLRKRCECNEMKESEDQPTKGWWLVVDVRRMLCLQLNYRMKLLSTTQCQRCELRVEDLWLWTACVWIVCLFLSFCS